MTLRPWLTCLTTLWLAGCQYLPTPLPSSGVSMPNTAQGTLSCTDALPDFDDDECLMPEWVAFGLASQRGDRAWREATLASLAGEAKQRRLSRAVLLSWGSEQQWDRASELYKADLASAPAELQPLLRYWLNELEGRRRLAGQLAERRRALDAAAEENAALTEELEAMAEKLEQLTAIEQNINLRQQSE
ncbi:hypothetical protein [Halomonas saccharevitans]|uniref:YfhG lipoprotein n=1 Tax=Halomonas saccharevitans TaxID=416872 RepID=A0A1I6ZJD5_9GAMM|nr:hypothetical protein [Halomonas saccharevitans]SFT62791.1 hypothetical protein SAMN04487956_11162 [Halomonas saccharevitans]